MKTIIFILTMSMMPYSSAQASETLPKLLCEVAQVAGNFNSFATPKVGEKLVLNLNRPDASVQNGRIIFSDQGYISMTGMPRFRIQRIISGTHDSGGVRLASIRPTRKVNIEILGSLESEKLNAWITNEEFHSSGPTLGVVGLVCSNQR